MLTILINQQGQKEQIILFALAKCSKSMGAYSFTSFMTLVVFSCATFNK